MPAPHPAAPPASEAAAYRMRVRFWGVRGSIATPLPETLGVGGNTACVEVRVPGGPPLVLDLGTGARGLGAALVHEADGAALDLHVLLSHFHWDHIQGFPFFAPLYGPGNRVTLYAADADGPPRALLEGQMQAPYFPVDFDELPAAPRFVTLEAHRPVEIGGARVVPFPVHHTQHVFGFRIEAGGACLVYCTDYEHGDPGADALIAEMARGADLLICDAQYTPEEYATREGWGHTTWEVAARLARRAGVARLALFHHDPTHADADLEEILGAARAIFPDTLLATEHTVVDL
ncbi:MAG TPA: MBL fold metallo-hydrolase [Rubricoccaceae bacterium]|nr:MBL fold metallo-hydrolase [Rubricoccaceae bacterium]